MQQQSLHNTLEDIIAPLAESHGLKLWGLEVPSSPRGGMLRVYVDSESGVGIDECAALSRTLSVVLDVEDPIPGSYVLEVSSPGLERPFFSPGQMRPYLGRLVAIELNEPHEGRRKWRGALKQVDEDRVILDSDGQDHGFSWDEIKKAHLMYEG